MPSSRDIKNLGGRPPTGQGTPVMVRLHHDQLAALDAWIADQAAPKPTRPEAIRRLFAYGLMQSSTDEGSVNRQDPRSGYMFSELQKAILSVLPKSNAAPVRTGLIMERLGRAAPSDAERVALSRSLARLEARGLIERREPRANQGGPGFLWRLRAET